MTNFVKKKLNKYKQLTIALHAYVMVTEKLLVLPTTLNQ